MQSPRQIAILLTYDNLKRLINYPEHDGAKCEVHSNYGRRECYRNIKGNLITNLRRHKFAQALIWREGLRRSNMGNIRLALVET